MTTDEILAALSAKYSAPGWAFFPEVRNGTGWERPARTVDALAMNLWPSRGLELHGFEVKASRGDWLKELKDPAKAAEMFAFCDRWWIAVGDKAIVRPGELPPTWGLLVPRGATLVVDIDAPKLEPKPMDRLFIAALLRKVTEAWTPKADIKAAADAAREEGRQQSLGKAEAVQGDLDDLRRTVAEFEHASGVKIVGGWHYGNIGRAVRDTLDHGPEWARQMIEAHKNWAERIVAQCDAALKDSSA